MSSHKVQSTLINENNSSVPTNIDIIIVELTQIESRHDKKDLESDIHSLIDVGPKRKAHNKKKHRHRQS